MTHGGEIDSKEETPEAEAPLTKGRAAPLDHGEEAADAFSFVAEEEGAAETEMHASAAPLIASVGNGEGAADAQGNELPADLSHIVGSLVVIPHPRIGRDLPAEQIEPEAEAPVAAVVARAGPAASRGGGWTIPMICIGIAMIAMSLLIPLADENHQIVYERERLKGDLEQIQKQVSVNEEFLKRIADDPTLAERLAQRQMKTIREGTSVLDLSEEGEDGGSADKAGSMSPYMLVSIPPPPAMAPYEPVGGLLARFCGSSQRRLFSLGFGLLLVAGGLVLGSSPKALDEDCEAA